MSTIHRLVEANSVLDVASAVAEAAAEHGRDVELYRVHGSRGLLVWIPDGRSEGRPSIPVGDHVAWRSVASSCEVAEEGRVALPLSDREGVCGVAVLDGPPGALGPVLELAGAALGRAIRTDAARWDAAALAALLPLLDEGVLMVTTDGEVVHYSDVMAGILGWTRQDVAARGWTNLVYATDEERSEGLRSITALVLGHPSEGIRRLLRCRSGEMRTVAIWSRLVPDPGGGAPGLLGVMRDETASTERQLAAIRQDQLQRLGQVARMVAHDFNNLLCAIMGHAELVCMASTDPLVVRHARSQLDAARNGAALVRQLLAFGSSAPLRTRSVPLGAFAVEVAELFAAGNPPGVSIEVAIEGEAPAAEADPALLHQAAMNLLANARHAVGISGRIVLSAGLRPLPSVLDAPDRFCWHAEGAPEAGTPMACLTVADDGPGFPSGSLQRAFEPFFTTRADGHGVGLAAVRGIVAQHAGAIEVSRDGGARVTLFVPISTRPEARFEHLRRERGARSGRVWVVDDQEQILEFSLIALSADGFEVRTFRTLDALLRAAAEPEVWPDVLVLDCLLSDGDSVASLPRLRGLGLTAPVLWVSGLGSSGLEPFLQKPYTGRDLVDAVEALLG